MKEYIVTKFDMNEKKWEDVESHPTLDEALEAARQYNDEKEEVYAVDPSDMSRR